MTATLHVCTTCRGPECRRVTAGNPCANPPEVRDGARLHALLATRVEAMTALGGLPRGAGVLPVECLSACDYGCNIALGWPGKWSYVYHGIEPANPDHLEQVAAGFMAYALSKDGIVPWRARPLIFRKQSLARVPPSLPLPAPAE